MKCLWQTRKAEKESTQRDKKERQAKKTKSYEIGAIGEGCESKKSKTLGMRACHARGRETPHKKISKYRRLYKAARLVCIFYTCKPAFFKFVNTDIYRLRNLQKKQHPSLTFRRRRVSKNLNQSIWKTYLSPFTSSLPSTFGSSWAVAPLLARFTTKSRCMTPCASANTILCDNGTFSTIVFFFTTVFTGKANKWWKSEHTNIGTSCMTPCIGCISIPCFGLEIGKNNNALPRRQLRVTHSPLPYSLPSSALQWGECCEDTSENKVYNALMTDLG